MLPQSIRDIIKELDQSSTTVLITFTKEHISFYTNGEVGRIKVESFSLQIILLTNIQVEIAAHSEQMELLECVSERVANSYRLTLIRRMQGCFAHCTKVSFRMDRRGVLSVQFALTSSLVEFFCIADVDDMNFL